jgi:deoxyadenosine/deoxycytidine kinase
MDEVYHEEDILCEFHNAFSIVDQFYNNKKMFAFLIKILIYFKMIYYLKKF